MSRKQQTAGNHARVIPVWHYVIPLALITALVLSAYRLFRPESSDRLSAAVMVLIVVILIGFYWYIRWFALRAQDRAIRAEENLRCVVLTGKPLDPRLRLGQIIALRFAPDGEFPGLANKAAEEGLRPAEIKKLIRSWRPDYHRV